MTRLTDEQIDNVVHDVRQALGDKAWYRHFADRIAALAVQEVERELTVSRQRRDDLTGRIGTLSGQLAEARQSIAEEEARADAIAAHRDALLAAYQSVREDKARLEAIVAKRLTIGECKACERDGEYRISVEAPSGCGHCNPPTLEGIRYGIDAALKMHPNHFARTGGTE
jgi:hypothetical protein